jgi:AcrR family transcriptional regulator
MTTANQTVREEQLAVTRRRILEACAELALRHGGLEDPSLFTFARVAELAGVSERTVYRAFPTKLDLTRAFLQESTLTMGRPLPADATSLGPFVRSVSAAWDAQFPTGVHGAAGDHTESATKGVEDEAARAASARDASLRAALATVMPDDVPAEMADAVCGVFRTLWSLRNVADTAARAGVTLREAGDAHAWAIETLIAALQRGEVPWNNHSLHETV